MCNERSAYTVLTRRESISFIHLHVHNITKCTRPKNLLTTTCDGFTVLHNALYTILLLRIGWRIY
jgi:hypothetical protein